MAYELLTVKKARQQIEFWKLHGIDIDNMDHSSLKESTQDYIEFIKKKAEQKTIMEKIRGYFKE